MRTPRPLITAFFCAAAAALMPALASEPQIVEIHVDLDAPAEEIYNSIREQSWAACKPEHVTNYFGSRMSVRRDCQRAMIADVVAALSSPDVIALAEKEGIHTDDG